MNIDIRKVLDRKRNPIQESFQALNENYSVRNAIDYISMVRKLKPEAILENSQYIYPEPLGSKLLLNVLKSSDISLSQLQVQKESVEKFINTNKELLTEEQSTAVYECYHFLKAEIDKRDTVEYLRENTIYNLQLDFLPKPTLESSVTSDMDLIIQNINSDPSYIDKYEKFVNKLQGWNAAITATNFVSTLAKNTAIIFGLTIVVTGTVAILLVSVPLFLVANLIKGDIDKKYVKSYIRIITTEIKQAKDELSLLSVDNNQEDNKRAILSNYITNLEGAKQDLINYSTKKVVKAAKEGITEMQPNIINAEEDSSLIDEFIDAEEDEEYLENEFDTAFVELFGDEDEDIDLEAFTNLIQIANKYNAVTEGKIQNIVKKGAQTAEKGVRNTVHAIRKVTGGGNTAKQAIQKIPSSFDNLVNNTLGKLKKMDSSERRRRIIEGGFKFKLYKLIRNATMLGVAYAVNPALAAIGLIAGIGVDKTLDQKERSKILHELENELVIVTEKIDDSRGDENKEKKYQLLRIKQKLEDDIARIRYRLD